MNKVTLSNQGSMDAFLDLRDLIACRVVYAISYKSIKLRILFFLDRVKHPQDMLMTFSKLRWVRSQHLNLLLRGFFDSLLSSFDYQLVIFLLLHKLDLTHLKLDSSHFDYIVLFKSVITSIFTLGNFRVPDNIIHSLLHVNRCTNWLASFKILLVDVFMKIDRNYSLHEVFVSDFLDVH